MGCSGKYCQFFLFRSVIGIKDGILTERKRLFWLVDAFELIDYNYEDLVNESFVIGQHTNVFTFNDLRDMDFKSYQFIVKTVQELNKKVDKNGS